MIITLDSIVYGDGNGPSDPQTDLSSFERSSILAPWYVQMTFSTDESIVGGTVYFNPFVHTALFTVESGIPTSGWKKRVPAAPMPMGPMVKIGMGSYAIQRENTEMQIEVIDSTHFIITHAFYQWFDHGGVYPNVSQFALDVLLKNHKSASSQLTNTFSSVYNTLKTYYGHVYVDAFTPSTDGELDVNFGVQNLFYNKLKTGWTYSLGLSRLSGPVTDLSTFEPTKVTAQITRPAMTSDTAPEAWAYLFRGDPAFPTNAQPVWTDVAADITPILDSPGVSSYAGKIYQPVLAPFLTGDTWETSFYIGNTVIAPGEKYYVAVLWYIHPDDGPPQFVYSVTLLNETPYEVTGPPEPLELSIVGEFDDYAKTASVNKPYYCPVQRFKWRAIIDGTGYDAAALTAGFPFTDMNTDFKSFKINVFSCATSVNYTAYKTGPGTWITSHPALLVQDFGSLVYVELDFRALYGGAYSDWQSCGVDFKIEAQFDYTASIPGFIVQYDYTDSCQIQRWDQEGALFNILTQINYFKASNGEPLQMICGDEDVRVQVVMDLTVQGIDPTDYIFQAFIDKTPYGVNLFTDANLKEHETYGPNTIAQKTNAAMYMVDMQFDALGKAYFTIAASSLIPGQQYYVYGAAVKKSLP